MPVSFVTPAGTHASDCGYCKSEDSSHTYEDGRKVFVKSKKSKISYGMWAHQLSCQDYQDLIDHGWRRSGKYLYKPNLRKSCCPQYTIRLDATLFRPSKSHKKVVRRVARFLGGDWKPKEKNGTGEPEPENEEEMKDAPINDDAEDRRIEVEEFVPQVDLTEDILTVDTTTEGIPAAALSSAQNVANSSHRKASRKKVLAQGVSWWVVIQEAEGAAQGREHELQVTLTPSKFESDTFELYKKYQQAVHHDDPSRLTKKQYSGFLVDSPLSVEKIDELPRTEAGSDPLISGYGSFHQKYYLDGRLAAVAVLDILPRCVSSVYFMYDPEFSFLSPGVYGALREIAFTLNLSRLLPDLKYYYMGFYIHSCVKMRYKAQYHPSDLLDPVQFRWVPFDVCGPILDSHKFASFVEIRELEQSQSLGDQPPDQVDPFVPKTWTDGGAALGNTWTVPPDSITNQSLDELILFTQGKIIPLSRARNYSDRREELREYLAAVGLEIGGRMVV
ncbi:arginine-tRNA--protein transferase 1, partial [Gonapodya prolifera JEL478]